MSDFIQMIVILFFIAMVVGMAAVVTIIDFLFKVF